MLRSACAIAAALGLTATAAAQYPRYPAPPVPYPGNYPPVVRPYGNPWPGHRPHREHYHVQYKPHAYGPWREYGVYRSEDAARCVARDLRRAGYRVRIDDHD